MDLSLLVEEKICLPIYSLGPAISTLQINVYIPHFSLLQVPGLFLLAEMWQKRKQQPVKYEQTLGISKLL